MHRTNPHFKFSASEKISIACCLVQALRICTKITANTPLTRARGICTLHTRRFEKCIICMTRMTRLTLISASVALRRPSTTKVTKSLFLSSIYINVLLKQREGNWNRNASRNCFWDSYWVSTGQLLANFFPVPSNSPRSLWAS